MSDAGTGGNTITHTTCLKIYQAKFFCDGYDFFVKLMRDSFKLTFAHINQTMRTVKDILQHKGPQFNYIRPEASVLEAITIMKSENISYLIVKDNDDRYLGIISERDYTHKVILENKHSDTTQVKEIMTTGLAIANPDDTTSYCMLLMNTSKERYLPVFDENNFRGVITIHDLMREAMADYEKGKKDFETHEKEFLRVHGDKV